jgi:serine/threonine-protein kinase
MADVFVSYKAEDRRRIKPLVDALQAEGYSVWWDEQIGGGAAWRQTIEDELNAAKCVIVIWSSRAVGPDGTFVQDEATRAQQRHVYVPVLIDKVHLPLGFGETQALPLTGWHGNRSDPRYEAVLAAVRRNVGGKRRSVTAALPKASVDRRTMIVGGSAAALAVAGVAGWELFKPSSASAEGTIAVLPFENLSGDPAQAYFSDGVAEEIRSALARVAGLKVAGSTSSEAVRNDDAETAAKKLGVANILTGSVRQSPSTIRVSAELIDGRTGLDRWSQDYDRDPGDAIKIQTDIAQNVATALSAALGQAAHSAIEVGGTSNVGAQKLFLKARAQMHADDSENSLRTGIGLLDSAIDLDPKFANAYATKAHYLADLNGYYMATGSRFEPGYVQAASVADQAISIAPQLAAGHMALAYVRLAQLDMAAAATEYNRGHALASGSVDDLLDYAGFLWTIGKLNEALSLARQAQSLDPLNPAAFAMEATCQRSMGRYDLSEAAYRKALALKPKALLDRAFFAITLGEDGKVDEAMAQFRQLPPDYIFRLVGESILFARQGNRAASDAALQRLQQLNGDAANYQYADIHAQRGEKDEAFASLDRAWSFRDPGLAYLKSDPWLAPIRSDPRFTAFLRKMNFPSV